MKTRSAGRIVSMAVIVAVGVNSDGRREVLGMMTDARSSARCMILETTIALSDDSLANLPLTAA